MWATAEDVKRWRELANEAREYMRYISTMHGRAELERAADSWERKAAEAEAALKIDGPS